jgi:hypothetical protein
LSGLSVVTFVVLLLLPAASARVEHQLQYAASARWGCQQCIGCGCLLYHHAVVFMFMHMLATCLSQSLDWGMGAM